MQKIIRQDQILQTHVQLFVLMQIISVANHKGLQVESYQSHLMTEVRSY